MLSFLLTLELQAILECNLGNLSCICFLQRIFFSFNVYLTHGLSSPMVSLLLSKAKCKKKTNHKKPPTKKTKPNPKRTHTNKKHNPIETRPKPTKYIPGFEWSAIYYRWFGLIHLNVSGNHLAIKFIFPFSRFLVTQQSFEQVLQRSMKMQSSKAKYLLFLGMKEWHCYSFLFEVNSQKKAIDR